MMFNRKITQNCHCEPLGEAIQPIETDVNRHKATGTNSCNHLITQSPVLDLLHAHGDSPEERCSSRLVPFAIRTRFAPSVRKSAIPLFPLPKWQYAQNPCPIRLSAEGGGG